MKLLPDTRTVLWFMANPERLPPEVTQTISKAAKQAFVSMATLWEIAIKVSLNKLSLPGKYEDLFPSSIGASGLSLLSIQPTHLAAVRRLEFHHRDPFDRLLIVQAKLEDMVLVSKDIKFVPYNVPILW